MQKTWKPYLQAVCGSNQFKNLINNELLNNDKILFTYTIDHKSKSLGSRKSMIYQHANQSILLNTDARETGQS